MLSEEQYSLPEAFFKGEICVQRLVKSNGREQGRKLVTWFKAGMPYVFGLLLQIHSCPFATLLSV